MSRTLTRLTLLAAVAVALVWAPGASTQTLPRPLNPRYRPYPYPYSTPSTTPAPAPAPSTQPTGPRLVPKLEPVAETRLLMEGLAHPNFRGLERLLKQKPADVQGWTFLRGQALLVAETANLLMLRPPRGQGQAVWFERAMDLRKSATDVAKAAASEDYTRARSTFVELANSCNRCHQGFRVPVEITPFQEPTPPAPGPKTSLAP